MKIILDTNVFVSGVFFSGPPYHILKAWREGEFELIMSSEILDEYRRVATILAEDFRLLIYRGFLNLWKKKQISSMRLLFLNRYVVTLTMTSS